MGYQKVETQWTFDKIMLIFLNKALNYYFDKKQYCRIKQYNVHELGYLYIALLYNRQIVNISRYLIFGIGTAALRYTYK